MCYILLTDVAHLRIFASMSHKETNRTLIAHFRVTPEERAKLQAAAAKRKERLSDFLRRIALRAANRAA